MQVTTFKGDQSRTTCPYKSPHYRFLLYNLVRNEFVIVKVKGKGHPATGRGGPRGSG